MARISGYSEDDVDVLVEDFQLVVSQAMQRAADRAAANLRPAVVAGTSTVVASSSAGLSPDDIAVFSTAWEEEIDGVLVPYVGEVYTGSAIHAAVGIGDAFPDDLMPGIPLVPDQFAVTYMQTVTNRLVGVGNELWEDIRNELLNGMHAGDSIEQIAARISHVAGVSQRRATTIARTEMHGAAESGSWAQMSFMGWEPGTVTKEWVAVTDGRTRLSHSLADGQRVGVDEMFVVGGSHLKFPGDPGGSPGETINCRCTTVFNVDEPPPFRCDNAITAAVAFHLAGQHDQRTHGRAARQDAFDEKIKTSKQGREALGAVPVGIGGERGDPSDAHTRWGLLAYHDPNGYQAINGGLRESGGDPKKITGTYTSTGGGRGETRASVEHLDGAMKGSTLTDDVVVYRGVARPRDVFGDSWGEDDMTGLSFRDHAFTSTTIDSDVAFEFAHDEGAGKGVFMRIVAPQGTHALALDFDKRDGPFSAAESEILLNRGLSFTVVQDHGVSDGVRQIDVVIE